MTATEFAKGILYLSAGIGKDLPDAAMEPYFDLLGDLDYETFIVACRRVLVAHVWHTFPTIAELRQAATAASAGRQLTAGEAFAIACQVAPQIDPSIQGAYRVRVNGEWKEFPSQAEYVMDRLAVPVHVRRAIKTFGIESLCNTDEPIGVMRAHFAKVFDQLQERDTHAALLPPSVREAIEKRNRDETIIGKALEFGGMPT